MSYTGLVKRLRSQSYDRYSPKEMLREAADAIEALTRPVDVEAVAERIERVARAICAARDGEDEGDIVTSVYDRKLAQAALAAMEAPHADG